MSRKKVGRVRGLVHVTLAIEAEQLQALDYLAGDLGFDRQDTVLWALSFMAWRRSYCECLGPLPACFKSLEGVRLPASCGAVCRA